MSIARAHLNGLLLAEAETWETVEGNVYVGFINGSLVAS